MAAHTHPVPRRETEANAGDWQIVERLAPHLRIAHQIPGRIRRVELNLLARSCVVEYDPAVIPDAAWPDLLGGRDTPAAAVLTPVASSVLHNGSTIGILLNALRGGAATITATD